MQFSEGRADRYPLSWRGGRLSPWRGLRPTGPRGADYLGSSRDSLNLVDELLPESPPILVVGPGGESLGCVGNAAPSRRVSPTASAHPVLIRVFDATAGRSRPSRYTRSQHGIGASRRMTGGVREKVRRPQVDGMGDAINPTRLGRAMGRDSSRRASGHRARMWRC